MIDKQKAQELNINIEVKNELFAYLKEHFPQSISENTPKFKGNSHAFRIK